MSQPAIQVENLSKQYQIGAAGNGYHTVREAITSVATAPFRHFRQVQGTAPKLNAVWALKDVSLEIRPGEVIGIIGRNGSGKSTLLKILSRITEPSSGRAVIHGRVASLLEVGTGFHAELTGRENIYLNSAILGMTRREMEHKFDEIVAFAGVERFLDTPVKRYSSGMYLRLAFAVAVHLEPEILVIDEVLAVGDAQFQSKCLEKMREISRGDRTILFVSHNMAAVRNICTRGYALQQGSVVEQGPIDQVVDRYLASSNHELQDYLCAETSSFVVNEVSIYAAGGPVIKTFDRLEVRVIVTAKTPILDPGLYMAILTPENQRLSGLDFRDFQTAPAISAGQQAEFGFSIDALPFLHGSYELEIYLKDLATHRMERVPRTFPFEIVETPVYGGRQLDSWYGCIGLKARACMRSL
jgi:lipopolysaccharide transport system ATP-binding protein